MKKGHKNNYLYFIIHNRVLLSLYFLLILLLTACTVFAFLGWCIFDTILPALISFFGTFILATITIWQQNKYYELHKESEANRAYEEDEKKRLSFMPCFVSSVKQAECNDIKDGTYILNISDVAIEMTNHTQKSATEMLEEGGKYIYLNYEVINAGRDTAIDIIITFKTNLNYESRVAAIIKGNTHKCYLRIEPLAIKEKQIIVCINYKSLNNEIYSQNEIISIFDYETDKSFDYDWKVEGKGLSMPVYN